MKLVIVAVGVCLFASAAGATELNAPINTAPTVQSEIDRGRSAASSECGDQAVDPTDFGICVSGVSDKNRQTMSNGYQAFSLGAYFYEWLIDDSLSKGIPRDDRDAEKKLRQKEKAKRVFLIMRDYQKKISISDDQFLKTTNLSAPNQEIFTAYVNGTP
jgi:hypothetical protein